METVKMFWLFLAFFLCSQCRNVESSCSQPLGMEDGRIKDFQITASSFYKDPVRPSAGRLNRERGGGAWCPNKQIRNMETREFLEIDLEYNHIITAVVTQGRFDRGNGIEFAEFYIVKYWREGMERFIDYTNDDGEKILEANKNTFTAVERKLEPAIIASKIRIVPVSHQKWTICLRVELKGCLITELDNPYWIGVAVGIFITVIIILIIVIIFIFYKHHKTSVHPAITFSNTNNYICAYDLETVPDIVYGSGRSRTLPLIPTSSEDNYTDSSFEYSGPLFKSHLSQFRTLQGVNTWHNKITKHQDSLHSPSGKTAPFNPRKLWQGKANTCAIKGKTRSLTARDYHPYHPTELSRSASSYSASNFSRSSHPESSSNLGLSYPAESSSSSSYPSGGLLCHIGRMGSSSSQCPLGKIRTASRPCTLQLSRSSNASLKTPVLGQRKYSPILAYNDHVVINKVNKSEIEQDHSVERDKSSKPIVNWQTFFPSPPPTFQN